MLNSDTVMYQSPRIKNIAFYPVKSTARIEVPNATLTESGLVAGLYADHEFMIVRAEPDGQGIHPFITQRDMRDKQDRAQGLSMALIKPNITGDVLHLTWMYRDPIEVAPDNNYGKGMPVRIHDDVVYAVDQGKRVSQWLSDYLGLSVKLVKATGSFDRRTPQNYMENDSRIRLQDAYPIHWFSIESIRELSQIANEDIPWQSFRPQIVMEGMQPQYEHKIHSGIIAGIPFIDPKPCDRCTVTNIDQETGEIKVGRALAPLSRYKKWRNRDGQLKVIFGENMNPLGRGEIAVGDEMIVDSYRDPSLVYGAKV